MKIEEKNKEKENSLNDKANDNVDQENQKYIENNKKEIILENPINTLNENNNNNLNTDLNSIKTKQNNNESEIELFWETNKDDNYKLPLMSKLKKNISTK